MDAVCGFIVYTVCVKAVYLRILYTCDLIVAFDKMFFDCSHIDRASVLNALNWVHQPLGFFGLPERMQGERYHKSGQSELQVIFSFSESTATNDCVDKNKWLFYSMKHSSSPVLWSSLRSCIR